MCLRGERKGDCFMNVPSVFATRLLVDTQARRFTSEFDTSVKSALRNTESIKIEFVSDLSITSMNVHGVTGQCRITFDKKQKKFPADEMAYQRKLIQGKLVEEIANLLKVHEQKLAVDIMRANKEMEHCFEQLNTTTNENVFNRHCMRMNQLEIRFNEASKIKACIGTTLTHLSKLVKAQFDASMQLQVALAFTSEAASSEKFKNL